MDLITANINNLTSLWSMAGIMDGQFLDDENFAISTVSESDWPNKIWFHRPPTLELLEEILNRYERKGITIPIWQNIAPEEVLISHGFSIKNELTGMSIQLKDNHYHTGKLSFQKVSDANSAMLWSKLFRKAFGYFISPKTVELTMDRVDYLIGNHGPYSIGTAVIYMDTPKVAGIHSIGVVPNHRRKGYAADLLNHVLDLAKQQGAIHATLQASSMAKELYLKTGFQEDFLIQNFVKH
ncbi:GNAT family N-acetyltransferase [Arenibacter troitsensis]|uniref:Acetyltransferase (GNAT) family protein n=1 Tax=Arenibacter troitsensis TaxID=188872 RepID=A0A1X7IRV1_9FLAO|nr:GNAT family N-acetyltransferase [Arenibacter troitsensis]SMG17539.1 Acetyltransferase (GNAT) family protein [Arenibacter troitsensis]